MTIKPYLVLVRPANVVTAIADILAGVAIAGVFADGSFDHFREAMLLVLSTIGLYSGGIVFNDVFDYHLDRVERPERVLPSRQLSVRKAKLFGVWLFFIGIMSASLVSRNSTILAIVIMGLALLYDKYTKHIQVLGPLNMGLCRAGNLLLGLSVSATALSTYWWIGIIPVIFIGAITLTSQKENAGNNRGAIGIAMLLDLSIVLIIGYLMLKGKMNLWATFPLILLWYAINAIAKGDRALSIVLTRADPDRLGIRWRNLNHTDRIGALAVE